MKKIYKVIASTSLVFSFVTPSSISKAKAEISPFALIETINDSEPNNYITNCNYLFGNGTLSDLTGFNSKSGEVAGTIRTSSDVDFYKFNVYSDSTLSLYLSAYDSSMNFMLNYNFTVYKQVNGVSPSPNNSVEIVTTNNSGSDDYFYSSVGPGTYYVKIFGENGSYSNRNSYKLSYSISPEIKHTLDLNQYVLTNPNSYLIWSSDFNFFETKKLINVTQVNITSYTNTSSDFIDHDVMYHYRLLNDFPNMEIYLWGSNLRTQIFNAANEFLIKLDKALRILDDNNEKVIMEYSIQEKNGKLEVVITVFTKIFEKIFDVSTNFDDFISAVFFISTLKNNDFYDTIPISSLITSYTSIANAVAFGNSSTETEIIALTQTCTFDFDVTNKKLDCNYLFSQRGTSVSIGGKYNGTQLPDVMGFTNDYGNYYNIYGDIYYPADIATYFL